MRSTSRIRGGTILCAILFALALALLRPGIASAHFEGDHWNRGGSWLLTLHYENNCSPSSYESAADGAANAWTATPTPAYFVKVTGNCQPLSQQVDLFTGSDSNADDLAWTQNYEQDCFIICVWDAAWDDTIGHSVIRMNTVTGSFGSLSAHDKQAAVGHELGHSMGLAHAGYYAGESTGNYSIMDYCCFTSVPLQHDINDLNSLYP